ncbi:hypothetical protein BDF14DRAFT_1889296 [Spinellus fusiger]|nr:hypothetical protein BDF14DRAFT_1889296 [Spinellus fusiger]
MQKIDDAIATFDDNGKYLNYFWEDIFFFLQIIKLLKKSYRILLYTNFTHK